MPKQGKKYDILGGIKVSSRQLSKWGGLGGRPKKWENEAERKRAERLRRKQEKLVEQMPRRKKYLFKEYGKRGYW